MREDCLGRSDNKEGAFGRPECWVGCFPRFIRILSKNRSHTSSVRKRPEAPWRANARGSNRVVPRLSKSPRPNVPPRLLESHAQVCTLSLTPAAETEAVRPASAGESQTEKEDNNRL